MGTFLQLAQINLTPICSAFPLEEAKAGKYSLELGTILRQLNGLDWQDQESLVKKKRKKEKKPITIQGNRNNTGKQKH